MSAVWASVAVIAGLGLAIIAIAFWRSRTAVFSSPNEFSVGYNLLLPQLEHRR